VWGSSGDDIFQVCAGMPDPDGCCFSLPITT
jgi:hypothetical protein